MVRTRDISATDKLRRRWQTLYWRWNIICFRISAESYNHVTGELRDTRESSSPCSHRHSEMMSDMLASPKHSAETGVNNCMSSSRAKLSKSAWKQRQKRSLASIWTKTVALTALAKSGIEDSIIIDCPEIKEETLVLHDAETDTRSWTNRVQRPPRKETMVCSRPVTCGVRGQVGQRFNNPIIVFADLTEIRDDIEYGTRMNWRLHSLLFTKLRGFIRSVKWRWHRVHQQTMPGLCFTDQTNRRKKRFNRCECNHQTTPTVVLVSARRSGCFQYTPVSAEMRVAMAGIWGLTCERPRTVTHHTDDMLCVSDQSMGRTSEDYMWPRNSLFYLITGELMKMTVRI